MAAQCFQPVGGNRMRVIALDSCGTVKTGVGSMKIISDGFVSVARTAQYEDPDEFIVKNANGDICLNYRTNPVLKWVNLEFTFCKVDPEMINVLTGSPLVLDDAATPAAVGFRTRENVVSTVNFSIEVWTNLGGVACSGGTLEYGYYLVPWVVQGTLGDLTIENGPVSFVVNARSKSGSPWGTGPFNIRNTKVSPAPAKLITAINALDHEHLQVVNLAPPAAACGATTVTPDA
jgi:hypothetical protein